MNNRAYMVFAIAVSSFLCFLSPAFGQDSVPGEPQLFAGSGHSVEENQDRLGLRDTPEDLMSVIYDEPVGPSRLIQRDRDDAERKEYGAFYYSNNELLSSFIDTAIYANPAIWEAEHRWRAALQRIPQVRSLPDPMFDIEWSQMPSRSEEVMFSISQEFPWFGKLDTMGELALRDALAGVEEYQTEIREVVAMVKQSYYDLAFLDEAIRITEEDKNLLEHFEDIAATRYSTGKGIQQEVIKMQAEITKDADRLYLLNQQRESVAANLNTLMNRPPHEPVSAITALSMPDVKLDLESLYASGRANQNELKAAKYMIEKGDQAIRLTKKEYFPDFNVGVSYTDVVDRPMEMDEDGYSIMLGFNIPLWEGKRMAAVKEARESKLESERGYERIKNAMEFSIRDGVLRAGTTSNQLALYEKVLIPQAQQAVESTESAYATGQLNALDLIDSERFLLDVRMAYAQFKTDYLKALADIERAIGAAFPAGDSLSNSSHGSDQ